MLKFADAQNKVNQIIDDFVNTLYGNHPIDRYRIMQYAMAVLCKAKDDCHELSKLDYEFEVYGIDPNSIEVTICKIREVCGNNLLEVLPNTADYILTKYSNSSWGEILQPRELTDLVHLLMKEKGCKSVYNPYAGFGSYALGAFIETYYGQEISHAICNMGKMRLELNNLDYSKFECCDSIRCWDDHNADCIVSTPPFGLRLDEELRRLYHASTVEELLLSRFISGNAQYGFFVVTRSVCFKSQGTAFDLRKDICDKHLLEMVINLPSGIFSSTGVSSSLIVLNRCRNKEDKVTFFDAEPFFITRKNQQKELNPSMIPAALKDESLPTTFKASYREIYENDCSFDLSRYATQNLKADEGQKIVALSDILTPAEGERFDFTGEFVNNVIESSNFASSFKHLRHDVDNKVYVDKPKYKFHGPHIAINMQGKIYIHRGNTDFYIGTALRKLVFKVDESVVDIEYLALILLLDDQLQRNYFGAGMARINPSQFLKYKIVIDDLSSQRQDIKTLKRNYLKSEQKRLGIREAGGDLTHMLGMPKDKIGNLIELLLSSESISEDDRMMVKAIDDNFRYMLRLINTVGVDFESVQGISREIRIAEMLKEYIMSLKNLKFSNNYKIENKIDVSDDVTIKCDVDLIRVVLDSAFRNAYSHGFEQKYSENNKVMLGCKMVDYEGKLYTCITIANNGNSMDPEFRTEDYATLGKKTGKMGNSGKGGYHIYAIAKKYDGYIRVSSSKEWPFILDVLIPAENWNSNEIIEEYGSKCL